jgi:hypothetical protein
MVGTVSLTDRNSLLSELDSAFKRDVLERDTFPPNTRNVEIKYKLSDLEVVINNPSIQLPITGYIQSETHHKVASSNLHRWFQANWSPVDGQLGRNAAYRDWSRQDPAYRHVQVSGEPAVATRGPNKNKVCVFARINRSCIKAVFAALSMLF